MTTRTQSRRVQNRPIFTREFFAISLRSACIVVLCSIVGLLIGCIVAFRATELKLAHYDQHMLHYAETFTEEIQSTLDAVNASPYPFCSDRDIANLRTIVFHGHLVKDIGRVRNGSLYCTSMSGRFPEPILMGTPDIVTQSGKRIWLNHPLIIAPGIVGDITQSGEADFVAARDTFGHLAEPPMTYTTTLTNRAANQVLPTAGEPLHLTSEEVLQEREVLRRDTYYVARCSTHFAPCTLKSNQ